MRAFSFAGAMGILLLTAQSIPAQDSLRFNPLDSVTQRHPNENLDVQKVRLAHAPLWLDAQTVVPSHDAKTIHHRLGVEQDLAGDPNLPPPAADATSIALIEPLLSTDSMIGPSRNADEVFSRLDLADDFRHYASPISTGPREDPSSRYEWMPAAYAWISPVFFHQPLYFEQPNLERYGMGGPRVIQPIVSSMHFFASIPLVPYKSLTHHPREHVYTLGNGRPGDCLPRQRGVVLGQSTVGEVFMYWEKCSGY